MASLFSGCVKETNLLSTYQEVIQVNELQIFNYDTAKVRVVTKGNEPWFVASDVCSYFGISNSRNVVGRLDEDEKGVSDVDTLGGVQKLTIINESGLYHLLFTITPSNARGVSQEEIDRRKEQLNKFKRWVTHEVIPSIRKHGLYAVDDVINNPDMLINALQALKAEREEKKKLELETAIQRQQIAEMNPKASYYDRVLACEDLVKVTVIAKDYGKSAVWLNNKLREKKIQYKQGEQWILYQKYAEQGYTHSFTYNYTREDGSHGSNMITKWTQKGRLFIYDLLKADGILPVCEREEK